MDSKSRREGMSLPITERLKIVKIQLLYMAGSLCFFVGTALNMIEEWRKLK
jgi:hypothetical protein